MVDKKKNKGTLKKVFSYIGKYKYFLILSMFFAAVTVGLTLYAPILVGKAIDCIIGKGNVDFVNMKSILIKVAVIVVSTALIQWLMNVCNNKITYNVSRDLRKKAFEKIEILPFSYIDTHSKGDIVSRVITDVDQLSDGLLMGFTQFFTGVITIIGTLAFMLSVNVFITIVVVVVTPLSFFISSYNFKFVVLLFPPPLGIWIFQQVRLLRNPFQPLSFFFRQLPIVQFEPFTDKRHRRLFRVAALFSGFLGGL